MFPFTTCSSSGSGNNNNNNNNNATPTADSNQNKKKKLVRRMGAELRVPRGAHAALPVVTPVTTRVQRRS